VELMVEQGHMLRYHNNPAETARVLPGDGGPAAVDWDIKMPIGLFYFVGRDST